MRKSTQQMIVLIIPLPMKRIPKTLQFINIKGLFCGKTVKVGKGDKNWTNNKLSLQADDIFVMLRAVALCPVWKVALEEEEEEDGWGRQTKQGI